VVGGRSPTRTPALPRHWSQHGFRLAYGIAGAVVLNGGRNDDAGESGAVARAKTAAGSFSCGFYDCGGTGGLQDLAGKATNHFSTLARRRVSASGWGIYSLSSRPQLSHLTIHTPLPQGSGRC
jgi:hypothetical protein